MLEDIDIVIVALDVPSPRVAQGIARVFGLDERTAQRFVQNLPRVVRRAARHRRIDPGKAKSTEIELVDEHFDHLHRVVFANVVIQTRRHQRDLRSVLALDESLHARAPLTSTISI